MRNRTALSIGVFFLLIAFVFAVLGRKEFSKRRDLREGGIVTNATVTMREGPYVDFGSRYRRDRYRYSLEYDGHRFPFASVSRYEVGGQLRLIYDKSRPSVFMVLYGGESGREGSLIDWRYASFFSASALIGTFALWAGFKRPPRTPRSRVFTSFK